MNSKSQRELRIFAVPLIIASIGAVGYVFYDRFVEPGIKLDQHMWANRFAVGWLWGACGVFVPLAFFLFFWTGLSQRIRNIGFGTGAVTWLAMSGMVAYAAYRYIYDFGKVWNDDEQRFGLVFGWAAVVVLVCSYRIGFMAIMAHPAKPWHHRLAEPDRLAVNDGRQPQLYNEQFDEPEEVRS